MLSTISILVTGKVQGVFFRQSTRQKAKELGITGSVKNKKDGTVYIIATGTAEQLAELSTWCKQGPSKAKVLSTQITSLSLTQFTDFIIDRE